LLSAVPRPDPDAAQNRRYPLKATSRIHAQAVGFRIPNTLPLPNRHARTPSPPLEFKEGRWVACPWA